MTYVKMCARWMILNTVKSARKAQRNKSSEFKLVSDLSGYYPSEWPMDDAESATGAGEGRCRSGYRPDAGRCSASKWQTLDGAVALQRQPKAGAGRNSALKRRPKPCREPLFSTQITP